jgi:hypothetical protein
MSRFNQGPYQNFLQVFGDNILLWFLPLNGEKSVKNGLSFNIHPGFAYDLVESI